MSENLLMWVVYSLGIVAHELPPCHCGGGFAWSQEPVYPWWHLLWQLVKGQTNWCSRRPVCLEKRSSSTFLMNVVVCVCSVCCRLKCGMFRVSRCWTLPQKDWAVHHWAFYRFQGHQVKWCGFLLSCINGGWSLIHSWSTVLVLIVISLLQVIWHSWPCKLGPVLLEWGLGVRTSRSVEQTHKH